MNNNIEKGRSMIEMLGVLAIITVLSVGGLACYSKAMQMYKSKCRSLQTKEGTALLATSLNPF